MNRNLVVAVVLAVIAALSGCAQTPPAPRPPNPETLQAITKLERIAVLPPEVDVTLIAFSGENERMPGVEATLGADLDRQVQFMLRQRNFTVRSPRDLPEERKQGLEFDVQQLRAALKAAASVLVKTAEEDQAADVPVELPKLTVGAAAGPVATRLDADAILLTRYSGFRKTSGQRQGDMAANVMFGAFSGFVRHSATEGGAVTVFLIDGATGDVLWAARRTDARFPSNARVRTAHAPSPAAATDRAITGLPARPVDAAKK